MKKLYGIQLMMLLLITVVPVICMENDRLITFKLDPGFLALPESRVQLMKTLNAHYQKYKARADVEGVVPLFPNVSAHAVLLVDQAFAVGPYKLPEYYNQLSADDRTLFAKVVGEYDDTKQAMLNVPELRNQLMCFTDPSPSHVMMKNKEDEDYIRSYFKEKLIFSKSPLGSLRLKEVVSGEYLFSRDLLAHVVDPGSVFLNGYHTQRAYNIPLYIGDAIHYTYGHYFVTDTRECRVTDVHDEHYCLWVIEHDAPDSNVVSHIKLNDDIKGCCFSKTAIGVGYAVAYSESDIVFSTITMQENGRSVIESVHVDILHNGTIIDACFDHVHNQLFVATYEGLKSVVTCWDMNGKKLAEGSFPFQDYAFLEKIFVSRNSTNGILVLLFVVADQVAVYKYIIKKNKPLVFDSFSGLSKISQTYWDYKNGVNLLKRGNSFFMYDSDYCPFAHAIEASEKKNTSSGSVFNDLINTFNLEKKPTSHESFFNNIINTFTAQPESECYRVYSPDGKFLMCNSLKNKMGAFWVETTVKDAVTHKPLFSTDTLYKNLVGVGFTSDATELIFLNYTNRGEKISLLNGEDKKMLQEIEEVAFQNVGVTALLKRLCMECKENGFIKVAVNDSTYNMLNSWTSKSAVLRKLLTTCLPLCAKKIVGQKK